MDQSELFGRVIKVAAAKPQKENNEGLGSKVAVWEQVSCWLFFFLFFVVFPPRAGRRGLDGFEELLLLLLFFGFAF